LRAVLLVEGVGDRAAVEALARRRGLDLAAAGVVVDRRRRVRRHGRQLAHRTGVDVVALYDAGEAAFVRAGCPGCLATSQWSG
jgi:predicted ATP-dependent endonuclease of OLD family